MKGMRLKKNFSNLAETGILKKKNYPEEMLQMEFANWLNNERILFTASCSGMRTFPKVMAKMRMMGAKRGVPDILIFEPNRRSHGMFLELKSESGKPSKEQKAWRDELNYKGYYAAIMPSGLNHVEGLAWLKDQVNIYMSVKR